MKINIGCKDETIKDYISVDINPDVKPDIIDDATTLKTFKDYSLDEIRAHNILEHIPQIDIVSTLEVWYKKLKIGGKINILVPDLKTFCVLYLIGHIREPWAFSALYSSHKSRNQADWHKSGFSIDYLSNILKNIGYKKIETGINMKNCELIVLATK